MMGVGQTAMTRVRNDVLRLLAELSECYPEWRFGQLVANVAGWTRLHFISSEDGARSLARRGSGGSPGCPSPPRPEATALADD